MTDLVCHLKAKDVEDYTKYNKLEGLNKEKAKGKSFQQTPWLKQISLPDAMSFIKSGTLINDPKGR